MKKSAILLMILLLTGLANGVTLDQAQVMTNGNTTISGSSQTAQTFTCGMNGQLDHIEIYVGHQDQGDQGYPTTVSIVDVISGVPSGSTLGSVDSHIFSLGWNSVDFSGKSVTLSAGTQYGIVLSNDDAEALVDPTLHWMVQWDGDYYANGALWQYDSGAGWDYLEFPGKTGSDGAFKTYMIPEPGSLLLFACAMLGVLRNKKHRRPA